MSPTAMLTRSLRLKLGFRVLDHVYEMLAEPLPTFRSVWHAVNRLAPGVEAWAVNAPPAMCVLAATLGGFGERPELVVSARLWSGSRTWG